ncbi:MAG: acyl-CoA thioesterase [Candidatus Kryptoniota bacterium]
MKDTEFKFSVNVPIRFSDMDSLGHVNNAVYLTYFEEARVNYLRKVLNLDSGNVRSIGIVIAEIKCTYRSPAYYGDDLRVYTRVTWIRKRSFEMAYLIVEEKSGRVVAEGSSIQVAFDTDTKQPIEIPPEVKKRIKEFDDVQSGDI